MSTLKQASHYIPGRSLSTLFSTQNTRNMHKQAFVATGEGGDLYQMYKELRNPCWQKILENPLDTNNPSVVY
jgi:hypothetical protein